MVRPWELAIELVADGDSAHNANVDIVHNVIRGLRMGGARWRHARDSFALETNNIRDGRQERFYSAADALRAANVDIALVQETKFLDTDFATKRWAGYEI